MHCCYIHTAERRTHSATCLLPLTVLILFIGQWIIFEIYCRYMEPQVQKRELH